MRHLRRPDLLSVGALALGLAAVGCGQASTPCTGASCNSSTTTKPGQPTPGATSFESDLPANTAAQGSGKGERGSATDAAGGVANTASVPATGAATPPSAASAPGTTPSGAADNSASGDSADVDRMITEADIIQMQGDTLYTLSREAGLGIIDASNPSALKLLGRYRELPAEPFEMYLRDGVALVMFTGWGQYVKVDDGYSFVSTSKLLALDTKDPAHVAQIGSFDVPGAISDSRLVGDVLYIVSYENGYCYDCMQNQPRTSITSLSVADAHAVKMVDQLFYGDTAASQYGGGPKSITVTTQRMYVAGPEYGPNMPIGSTVQVVDISDPKGDLVEGAHVQVGGQINSRWQMDEYDGVLRVVSQPLQWWSPQGQVFSVPTVETFKIESSSKLSPLGKTNITLPQPESLRSARFDGTRAYAITAQQTDPLFTIDLSDPTAPKQVGSVTLPGYIWHMQPRGDRLLAIGFEQGNAQGSIVASLFDVSALATPKLLSQARFGGSWGNLPEDQDRADKVIRVFDDANLLLVPFSGWQDLSVVGNAGIACKVGNSLGGVELIDFQGDTIKARGATKTDGQARRGFLQHDQLLSVSDERVQAFDISDRDNPKQTSEVVMARQVWQARQLDSGAVARFSYDESNGAPTLDLARTDAAGEPNESLSQVDLSTIGGMSSSACAGNVSIQQVLVEGSQLDLIYSWYSADGTGQQQTGLAIIDASKPDAPKLVSDSHWNNQDWSNYYGYYSYGFYNTGDAVVRTDHAIAVLEVQWVYTPISSMQNTRLRVMDMRDPANVKSTTLPLDLAMYSGLIADGDTLLTSHLVPTSNNVARGKFYVDRFDLSDPSAPKKQGSVNVPGALIAYDGKTQRAFTSEQQLVSVPDLTSDECYARFGLADWNLPNGSNGGSSVGVAIATPAAPPGAASSPTQPVDQPPPPKGQCNGYRQNLHLVQLDDSSATLLDTYQLDEDDQASSASMGDGVVFASIGHGGNYGFAVPLTSAAICLGCGGGVIAPAVSKPSEVLVLGGIAGGDLQVGQLTVDDDNSNWWGFWGTPPVYASGKRALALSQSDAAIIDATNPADPKIVDRVTLIASPSYTDVKNDTALLTLGAQGVQWIPLK